MELLMLESEIPQDLKQYFEEIPESIPMPNVWRFATQPFSGAHFAVFPEELPRRCIRAATSETGCCAKCGAPWVRVVERPDPPKELRTEHHGPDDGMVMGFGSAGSRYGTGQKMQDWLNANPTKTIGWRAGCGCEVDSRFRGNDQAGGMTVPCLVLDPFGGSGTTAKVAIELGRRAVSLDLAYHELAKKRTRELQPQLAMI